MQSTSPDEAVRLIRTRAAQFETGEADDPRRLVDHVMAEIEAVLSHDDESAPGYLDKVAEQAGMMLTALEKDNRSTRRRLLFLRSIVQLLASRRALIA